MVKRLVAACLVVKAVCLGAQSPAPLVVHEWGTITTRHAPDGKAEGRLNHIAQTEVLPPFVHKYEPPPTQKDPQQSLMKTALAPGRPDVTMRLETPVLYFHPAPGASTPQFDVSVEFRGGVLNEFYPEGAATVDVDFERVNAKMRAGLIKGWDGAVLNNYVIGALRWNGLTLKETVPVPQTESHVWLAPRNVKSTGVANRSGEGERYLFYRGVAHLDALVQTELLPTELRLRAPAHLVWMRDRAMTLSHLWLVDIRPNGGVAFRERKDVVIAKDSADHDLGAIPLFAEDDFSTSGLAQLRASMKQALVGGGLFEDEADAMLETWKDSYFGAPGLRVFYTVPAEWAGYFLPLHISVPNQLTRVLIGRIDLER